MLQYLSCVSLNSSICASNSASTVLVPRPRRSDSSWRVNLYVLNDQARNVSSLDCVGDCGADREDGGVRTGRGVVPAAPGVVAWSGVDSGILLVAIQTHTNISPDCTSHSHTCRASDVRFYSFIGYAEWHPRASPPEVCQSFKEVQSTWGLSGMRTGLVLWPQCWVSA